jgi:hypothetical protein
VTGSNGVSSRIASLWGPLERPARSPVHTGRAVLLAVLIACFLVRFGLAWRLPSIQHADEIYQVAEQATHAARGYGIVPWEFRTASRVVLLPTLVEPIYLLDVSARTQRLLQSALFCALSLIPVWVAFQWGLRLFGPGGAVLASIGMGSWFELVYFAPKATADAVCSYFVLGGVYLARPSGRRAEVFVAGFSLALALALRVQIAPAVALAFALALAIDGRERRLALLQGAAVALTIAGLAEWRWWGRPFQGQIGYLLMELTHHSSRYFGRQPFIFYAKQYILMYGAALPVLAFFAWRGARKAPVLLILAVAMILPFQFVGHKEYRFLVAALPMLVLLFGLGASELVGRVAAPHPVRAVAVCIAGWLVAMLAVGFGDTYRPYWTRDGNHVLAFEAIGEQPDACGVAIVGIRWWHTPGYSGLGRNLPIYEVGRGDRPMRIMAAANYLLVAPKAEPPPAPFERWRAFTRPVQYIYRRPGGCTPDPSSQVVRPDGIPGVE